MPLNKEFYIKDKKYFIKETKHYEGFNKEYFSRCFTDYFESKDKAKKLTTYLYRNRKISKKRSLFSISK